MALGRAPWRGGRVVDGSGLENRRPERVRGFESHPLRFQLFLTSRLKANRQVQHLVILRTNSI